MSASSRPQKTPADAEPTSADLAATFFIESDNASIIEYATRTTAGLTSIAEQAAALFLAVRDDLRYDPFALSTDPEDYRASNVLEGSQRWCVSKAVLLAAAARAVGIPSRLGYSDVKNHLQTPKLEERMGTDVFTWHGYTSLWIDGRWLKASPAFNKEMCERFGTKVLDFDGTSDALLHTSDESGNRHMEYVADRGTYSDLPLEEILETFADVYPKLIEQAGPIHDELFHG